MHYHRQSRKFLKLLKCAGSSIQIWGLYIYIPLCNVHAGFYESRDTNTFGKMGPAKKPGYRSASDFKFDIKAKVVSMNPDASGFLIDLYVEKKAMEEQLEPL